jgi:uncharacterized protein (TIGR02596 family)
MPLRKSPVSNRAFTLIEMLVVMAIVVILGALAIPLVQGTSRAYQLDATGQLMINQLALARQNALTSNHMVEVRFYQLPDYNQSSTGPISVYRGMQCFEEGDPTVSGSVTLTALTPLSKPAFFPAPVVLSTINNVSPLLSPAPAPPSSTDPMLPNYQANYKYSSFHFKPDGSTDLTNNPTTGLPLNSVTLVLENDKAVTGSLPNNYETLQVDPAIGTVRRFLP